ncbi:MAG TPA: DNA repair protein RecN [Bdellovibrionales bacterium]|nr:DNA repair protein RecN [Bdellovibrionales bacterium]
MLIELKVKNFAIIENLELNFGPGLNILSGETGAGKSILLKSLSLMMGEKAEADVVRGGVDQAVIEGYFDLSGRPDVLAQLEELGLDVSDQTLVVRRIVSKEGKGKVYLNGALSPLASLRAIVAPLITLTGRQTPLIEMTGQHDNRHLQSKAYHLEVLDQYAGSWTLRVDFEKHYERLRELEGEITRLEEANRSREQRLDFLKFQRDEIETLDLKAGEEEEIETRVSRMRNSTRLIEFVSQSVESLYSNDDAVMVALHQVLQRAGELGGVDPELAKRLEPLHAAKAQLEDGIYELRDYGKNLDADPEELNRLEERLSSLRKLQKKFGKGTDEILKAHREMVEEIDQLEKYDENLKSLEQERQRLQKSLAKLAKELHERRKNGAELLEKGVNDELGDLNMKGVLFSVQVEWASGMTAHGQSDVEFMIQASKKDGPRPMAKVASGGELSRILLALKRVVGSSDRPRTYLFDEVDTGVSGQTAEKVGRKLKTIAKGQQLICVTHLPQVASFADQHFLIEKSPQKGGGIRMSVDKLAKDDRVKEIARLISGEKISQTSLEHARQLLNESR